MSDDRPHPLDYPDTPEGRHMWAQAVPRWNHLVGVTHEQLIKQWNEERKKAR